MKYLLFINFNSGLMHNSEYNTLGEVCESVKQLICLTTIGCYDTFHNNYVSKTS